MSLFNKAKFAALVMVTTTDSTVARAVNTIENGEKQNLAFLERGPDLRKLGSAAKPWLEGALPLISIAAGYQGGPMAGLATLAFGGALLCPGYYAPLLWNVPLAAVRFAGEEIKERAIQLVGPFAKRGEKPLPTPKVTVDRVDYPYSPENGV